MLSRLLGLMRGSPGCLRFVAALWVAIQLLGSSASLGALLFVPLDTAEAREATCCPGMAPGQICPMHHTPDGRRKCVMTNACRPGDGMIVSLLGVVGVVAPSLTLTPSTVVSASMPAPAAQPIARAALPEAPPPKA